mmetsp:Transcript_33137/g.76426  ORF Transcript_33137/g.76426 Transcript_33137/m.76426 type:complete len:502 (-) Transcript_33137:221-1726(-)
MNLPSQEVIDDNVDVAIHEAAHVLGMSSNSFRFFRDKITGEALTDRPITPSSVTCVDGVERTVYLPSNKVLKFSTNKYNGKRTATIVTDLVTTVTRNQFDCDDLAGANLENQPTGSGSCTGDHWDERQFYPEALSGVISTTQNTLSPLTLALFEDSGWYQANYSKSNLSPWGHGAGCEFVHAQCIDINGQVADFGKGYFCNEAGKKSCSAGNTHKMSCTLLDYAERGVTIPRPFQYFSDTSLGGPIQIDYCPVYSTSYGISFINEQTAGDNDCRDPKNAGLFGSSAFFEEHGTDSRCFDTSRGEGKCYRRVCIKDEHVVKFFVRDSWYTCEHDFQEIQVYEGNIDFFDIDLKITCPRLSSVCPDLFCPANCSGRGKCVWIRNETNLLSPPRAKCECFDESDTSSGCSSTLVLSGDWVDNAGGLASRRKDGFFDGFVKLFIDEPSTWSNATKIWGCGLAVMVALILLCLCHSLLPRKKKKKKRKRRRSRGKGRKDRRRQRRR